jgi:hypothetical protein
MSDVGRIKRCIGELGKISYFKKDGRFIREKRTAPGRYFFHQLGEQLLGFKAVVENEETGDWELFVSEIK